MKFISLSLSLVFLGLCSINVNAQLYSSGNNTITGNKVGIGINNPQATLQIKDFSISGLVGGSFQVPLIRLQSFNPNTLPVSTNYVDLRMDNSFTLTFWHHSNSSSPVKSFALNQNFVKIYTMLKVGDYAEYGGGITPDGSQGHFISLGLKQFGTNGTWNGSGATLFTTSTGEFQIMTNPSGTVSDPTNMLNQVRFSVNEKNAFFSVPVRIGGNYGDVNVLQPVYNPSYNLYVKKGIRTEKLVIDYYTVWPDYVFTKNYNLRSLTQVKSYITQNGHLPEVPSTKEVKEEGINVGEMNVILLKKVEELTLYLIELEARLAKMESKL